MSNKKNIKDEVLPDAAKVTAKAPKSNDIDFKGRNKIALRRQKVSELLDMGYESNQIYLILKSGIKVGNKKIDIKISKSIINSDISYVQAQQAARDEDFPKKRAEIVSKLKFLYNKAMVQYVNAKGQTKNSFLNTALSVLKKLADIEGVESPENLNVNLRGQAKVVKFANEVRELKKDERQVILSSIRQVLGKRNDRGLKEPGISSETSKVSTSSSDDEKVSRKS